MDVSKAIDKSMGVERKKIRNLNPHRPAFGANTFRDYKGDNIIQPLPATPEAAAWQGFGTCLKPACEPIVVARKPLEGTVATNVLKYGTGAINIDECSVPYEAGGSAATNPLVQELRGCKNNHVADKGASWRIPGEDGKVGHANMQGRFPANFIHDGSDEVLEVFPNDSARFFYCAKASKKEKGKENVHPTVKPIELMKYLVKLVAPKGALVLDPFMGSGSTGVAAIEIGRRFIGIEKEPEYFKIAEDRIEKAKLESPEVV
jgi:site-specific DNA-methyltransferase (adenine-specific)